MHKTLSADLCLNLSQQHQQLSYSRPVVLEQKRGGRTVKEQSLCFPLGLFPPFPPIHKQEGPILEEMLSRVVAFPCSMSWSHNMILLREDIQPKKVCPHNTSQCLQLHTLNKMKITKAIESFLISHATQDKDLRLMQYSSLINLKNKRRLFSNLKYVWRIH